MGHSDLCYLVEIQVFSTTTFIQKSEKAKTNLNFNCKELAKKEKGNKIKL